MLGEHAVSAGEQTLEVCLVLKDRGWILEKMAERLAAGLAHWNVRVSIALYPSPSADINHWMWFCDVGGQLLARNTLLVTHVDRAAKLHVLKHRLRKADMAICMSRMTLEALAQRGIPRAKLCYITPAHDGTAMPKRIVIGITSQIRADGAKREDILIETCQAIRLDLFHFEIIGPNWAKVIPYFEAAGATVNYHPGAKDNASHRQLVLDRLQTFDYYLYMGFDEGSMGLLDALAAGIPTIVTPQGFHLDIEHGITHAFSSAAELSAILVSLSQARQQRIDGVSHLTWKNYARQHVQVWRAILDGRHSEVNDLLHNADPARLLPPIPAHGEAWPGPARFYTYREFAAFSADCLMLWELYTGTKLQETPVFRLARSVKRSLVQRS
jgi:hypothetical protein